METNTAPTSMAQSSGQDEPVKKDFNRKHVRFPRVGDLFAMLGIFLLASVVAGLVVSFMGFPLTAMLTDGETVAPEELGKSIAIVSFLMYSLCVCGILIYRRVRGGRGRIAHFSHRGFNPALLLWGVVLIFSMGVILEPLLNLLPQPSMQNLGRGGWTILAIVGFAPVFEELICRGVVLESLRTKYGVFVAWLVSSLFFAIMHGDPMLVVNAFFMGLVLAYIYIKSESIYSVIILHAVNNAIAYLLMSAGYDNIQLIDVVESRMAYGIIYCAALAICLVSAYGISKSMMRLRTGEKNSVSE